MQPDYWHVLNIGDAMFAFDQLEKISQAFTETRNALVDKASDAAIFSRNDSEGRLHCQVMVFFSPSAAAIAQQFGAEPCVKPPRAGLGLLAGDPGVWDRLF